MQRGDRITGLAEDDDSYEVGPKPSDIVVEHEEDVHTPKTPRPERVLFAAGGAIWMMIQLLDDFVVAGSSSALFGLEAQEQ